MNVRRSDLVDVERADGKIATYPTGDQNLVNGFRNVRYNVASTACS